jgi:hypothetical protein
MKARNGHFLVSYIFNIDLHFADLGVQAAPDGQTDIPAGGVRGATPAGRSLCPRRGRRDPQINEIEVKFKMHS